MDRRTLKAREELRRQLSKLQDVDEEQQALSSADSSASTVDSSSTSSSESEASTKEVKKSKKDKKKPKLKSGKKGKSPRVDLAWVQQLLDLEAANKGPRKARAPPALDFIDPIPPPPTLDPLPPAAGSTTNIQDLLQALQGAKKSRKVKPAKSGTKVAFKRVDQVYDRKIHNFKLKETVHEDPETDEFDQYIFTVRRTFDANHRHSATFVDIKSKHITECLKQVMADVKGITLVGETPSLDPKMLFLYLEELRGVLLQQKEDSTSLEAKEKKMAKTTYRHLKLLVKYLDEDFDKTKKELYPMLESGIITFEYLWALFKPNEILYATTYGDEDEPRAVKTMFSRESRSFNKGRTYNIEGRYFEYDGKTFGMSPLMSEIEFFYGSRKINTLSCYPIKYHKDPESAREALIERGKKFVSLSGMNYKTYAGMSYVKKDDKVLKVDVNGRIMVDPAIFRRVNANYPLKTARTHDDHVKTRTSHTHIDEFGMPYLSRHHDLNSNSDDSNGVMTPSTEDFSKQKHYKLTKEKHGSAMIASIDANEALQFTIEEEKEKSKNKTTFVFSEEQLLLASSVVIGFSFTEKMWLEFAVSKVGEVAWNVNAFDSLILPPNQKSIVKSLVSSHAFHPSRSIDDIIAGKGKGLVAVLHGGPGLGKTLTVESIADHLRRPLYMVSAGDLGTSPQHLERQLQEVLDIAHCWGAVLLLDEADVFLEKRSTHDIHRNALVSIFLRLLEYFQGILFLTTNRVEVFDEAFVSRIHLSLRYGDLSTKAKKAVWKTFLDRVRDAEAAVTGGMEVEVIGDKDLDDLSRRALNGRQIKNIVRAAQALAINEGNALGLAHIKTVLDVAQTFERDLKGGTGYEEAMRGYT